MSDYISREAVNQIIAAQCGECADACLEFDGIQPDCNQCLLHGAAKAIKDLPAADVRPARRGKWKRVVDFTGVEAFGFKETMVVGWGCNVCGYEVDASEESFNYCPNCGADMRGEQDV